MSLERDLKMRCLELAVRLCSPRTDLESILPMADSLYNSLPNPPSKTQEAVQRALGRESVPMKKGRDS